MTLIFKSPREKSYFFGYYGKSQLDKKNYKLLALETNFTKRLPQKGDEAKIGYFEIKKKKAQFKQLATTKTFNWQQGCMLQWLGPKYNNLIIYNDIYKKKFCSIIMNTITKKKFLLPMPVYDVNAQGTKAICIDFERHYFCRRGYSYAGIENFDKNKKVVEDDGIWLLSLKEKKTQKIINILDLINFKPLSNMKEATHYIEHLMFRPDGKRFCFLHRWKMKEGGIYTRFYTANLDGSDLYLLLDTGRMSHFCWRNNKEILGYGGMPNPINKLRKNKNFIKIIFRPLLPIYHFLFKDNSFVSKVATGDSYILLKDKTSEIKKVASELKYEDGHPSFLPNNKNIFVTDVYPKKFNNHIAKLMTYDLTTKSIITIDKLESNPIYNETPIRCDLHPKISFDGKYVAIDILENETRGINLYMIKTNKN